MPQSFTGLTRRKFLAVGAAAAAAPSILTSSAKAAPSERITVGVVGLGSRGFNLVDDLLHSPDAQIVAVCDVDTLHYRDQPWGNGRQFGLQAGREYIDQKYGSKTGVSMTRDYRDICARDDIDAVVVATPDHWHALCTLEALRGGKDVYCEKPVTHTFREGQTVYREVAKQKAIFQTGSQQRSDWRFRRAVELVHNGHLGEIRSIEVGLPPGYDKPQGDPTVVKPPEHLDYDFWCGPAPMLPYMQARHHRWWRGHRAFGGGVLMDWIGHHNDITHWALDLDQSGPVKVEAVGWTFPETDIYNTPFQYELKCEYEGGAKSSISSRNKVGTRLVGDKGWVFVTRGKIEASQPAWTDAKFDPGSEKVYASDNHMQNFLNGVRTRRACICPAETGHRSITPGHLAYVSQALGRALQWDAKTETVVNDRAANELLQQQDYRQPWG
ncbi:Gfo/Idh/MocA family oxidoreductase [Blastopirellula sp. JC732]|uniref:Gfo/Idh/MocA family oxidoreductase n=1 Tax=Blastopirellula sediminis TaxID=2894196 RepID=A0A9X1MNJ0_9BACT|nr:Gfo/Idh/MocA family oxidoreductase [Blastopirellula sediminis]MCC9606173.1 Gfo/Idh/MocA family oxidoreductase [Blastopirellula sediminis]MCC9630528.1 Gfo/Idh/MocA family oxidoreductase [Blastopirellula sediminis]